jgi:hypothetical protein
MCACCQDRLLKSSSASWSWGVKVWGDGKNQVRTEMTQVRKHFGSQCSVPNAITAWKHTHMFSMVPFSGSQPVDSRVICQSLWSYRSAKCFLHTEYCLTCWSTPWCSDHKRLAFTAANNTHFCAHDLQGVKHTGQFASLGSQKNWHKNLREIKKNNWSDLG